MAFDSKPHFSIFQDKDNIYIIKKAIAIHQGKIEFTPIQSKHQINAKQLTIETVADCLRKLYQACERKFCLRDFFKFF